jgi:WD40 repeat protein
LHFNLKAHIVLVGSGEGTICVIDLVQRIATRVIEEHRGAAIISLDSFYNGTQTCWLAASQDRKISVWSAKWRQEDPMLQMIDWLTFPAPSEKNSKQQQQQHSPSLARFEQSPHVAHNSPGSKSVENLVYVGCGLQKQIIVYNFVKKQIVRTMDLSEWPQCLSLSNRLNLVAIGTQSRLLQLKDYNQSSFQDYSQHSDTVSAVCFSHDDKKLISTAYNEIFIWDVNV